MFDFDSILSATGSNGSNGSNGVISENNNFASINWVRGMVDPGEMLGCGRYQQLRRLTGENDSDYQARLEKLLPQLPSDDRAKIESAMRAAAIKRAGLATTAGGKIAVAFADEGGWHTLGTVVRGAMDAAEAMRASGLDLFQYVKNPNQTIWEGAQIETGGFSILRTDCSPPIVIAQNVRARYTIFSPADMVGLLDDIMAQGLQIDTIGALDNGRALWAQARYSDCEIGGDEHKRYVSVHQMMDGTGAISIFPGIERIVCKNTARIAMGEARGKAYSLRHTSGAKCRAKEISQALAKMDESFNRYVEKAQAMRRKEIDAPAYYDGMLDLILDKSAAGIPLTGAGLRDGSILERIAQIDDADRKHSANLAIARFENSRRDLLTEILERHNTERNGHGSADAWHCAQTISETVQHGDWLNIRGEGRTRLEKRLISNDLGRADDLKQLAQARAWEMIAR